MTHELRLERQYDAPPDQVFDTFAEGTAQGVLHGDQQGWNVEVVQTEVRVGGTSIVRMAPAGQEQLHTETRVYSVVDRPHHLELTYSMALDGSDGTLDTDMTVTFEERDGGTWFTMVETGFEDEAVRDGFREGWTEYLENMGQVLKARHDTA